jgi:putative membrane protein
VRGSEPSWGRCGAPVAGSTTAPPSESHREVRRGHVLLRAPKPPVALGLTVVLAAALAALLWLPDTTRFLEGFLLVVVLPTLLGVGLTTPMSRALGGRFEFHRSAFLGLTVLLLQVPLAVIWRGAWQVWPGTVPSLSFLAAFLAGPAFWFRHLSLYGVSRPSHARMLPVSLLPPLLYLVALFLLFPPSWQLLVAAAAFLVLAFVCALAMLRAADRPLRREFQMSGVSLIRPLLDHVGSRDPGATRSLEAFFLKSAIPADLRVSLFTFVRSGRTRATLALPTVHPGPFAALGASDLPRKLSEALGADAGVVLVPHTPSDHDLDLPSEAEVQRVGAASRELLAALTTPLPSRASPLVSPYPASLARAQLLGDVVLVAVSQAPAPTDDIAFSVADRITRELTRSGGPRIVLVDAHNSYVEGLGDILYGTPIARKLGSDVSAAIDAALAAAKDGPIEVGVSVRSGYSIGEDGIGPQGMRALVVRAGARTTGYLLIDGNNLLVGQREPIVRALEKVVDVAEVMTTDNHVVHEVDGGINPVGERYPLDLLVRDAQSTVTAAVADLAPAEVRFGTKEIPGVRVLGPGHTARLLTSLGDTLSMFTNMFPATLLLLLTSSLVVTFALQ